MANSKIANSGDYNGVNYDIVPNEVKFEDEDDGPQFKFVPDKWGDASTGDKVEAASGMAGSLFSGLNEILNYQRKKAAAETNIKDAKFTHKINTLKFGLNRQDSYFQYLQSKHKLASSKLQSFIKIKQAFAESSDYVVKQQDALTGTINKINHQLLDGYNRMNVTDMNTIQGQLAMSSYQVEKAKVLDRENRMNIKDQENLTKDISDIKDDQIELNERTNQAIIGLKMAEETYEFERTINQIKFDLKMAEKRRNGAIVGGILGAVGGVVGGIFGGPAGMTAGNAIGSGAGNLIGSEM